MVRGFNSKMQAVCTLWCMVALVVAAISTIMAHTAFSALAGPVVDFPANLEAGLEQLLHLSTLGADLNTVQGQAEQALGRCNATFTLCSSPDQNSSMNNVTAELAVIDGVFRGALTQAEEVANDPYLGVGDFAVLARSLGGMRAELAALQNQTMPMSCAVTNGAFCRIHQASREAAGGLAEVRAGIDSITNSDAVEWFERYSTGAKLGLQGLPFLLWLAMLFYLQFFCSRRPSCKGSACTRCVCTLHAVFFGLSLVLVTTVFVVGLAMMRVAQTWQLGSPFQGNPTVAVIVEHLEETFPGFYDLVLRDLMAALKTTFIASLAFTAAHLMLLCHTSTCCCGTYVDEERQAGGEAKNILV